MDVARAESPLQTPPGEGWWARATGDGRLFRYATWACTGLVVVMLAITVGVLSRDAAPGAFVSPLLVALLLVANLLPAIALMVLLSRKLAIKRASEQGMGSARLHTRLVALFSVIAAVPTVLVVIFASFLLQSGLEFWFSDRARGMIENTVVLARSTFNREVERVANETVTMSGDLAGYLKQVPIDDPVFAEGFGRQVLNRNLSEAAIVTIGPDGQLRTLALVNP